MINRVDGPPEIQEIGAAIADQNVLARSSLDAVVPAKAPEEVIAATAVHIVCRI